MQNVQVDVLHTICMCAHVEYNLYACFSPGWIGKQKIDRTAK